MAGPATSSAVGYFVVAVGTVPASVAAWWSGEPVAGLVVLSLVVGGYAAAIRNAPGALVTSALGWMLLNGFVVHTRGDLAWEGVSDAVRLGTLAGAALIGVLCGWVAVRARERSTVSMSIPTARPAPRAELVVPSNDTAPAREASEPLAAARGDRCAHPV
ncbi:hypothetical protein [Saccharopolyspora spinosa]|uniref:hypothetical protein n=1 Tax=Saccharopolyspora spinosa TaxID=60894 RepID=UPI0004963561